ncbi:MAG: MBL fold metallo-hydrolase [Acidobacteria bacterium]|nr:MBL fold metallo-hydrolase [Acidobacteriota bacterium]
MTPCIHPVRLPFVLPLSAEKSVHRFVYAYVIVGKQTCIVDTGPAGCEQGLVEMLAALGRSPAEVAWVVNTHEHPDHVGGNSFFQEQGRPQFACHARAARWIENLDAQYRERPLYGFDKLAGKAVRVSRLLQDGDEIDLGNGIRLRVIYTPGHSPGSVSLFCTGEDALITADAIQPVGGLPLYSDLPALRQSLGRLLAFPGIKTLYCAHSDRAFAGDEIPAIIQSGLDYLDRVDAAVKEAVKYGATGPEEITREALLRLGMTPPPVMPITIQSILSHLQ